MKERIDLRVLRRLRRFPVRIMPIIFVRLVPRPRLVEKLGYSLFYIVGEVTNVFPRASATLPIAYNSSWSKSGSSRSSKNQLR